MKTYLMNIPETLRGISNKLDVKAALCDKSWIVFNEDGVRLLFIFENDGSLIVSKNGVVSRQKWSYIKANSTVLIEDAQQAFLLHPVFLDDVIFALQQDGTQHHLFMIDENKQDRLSLLTINSIIQYFKNKENQNKDIIEPSSNIRIVETEKQKKERIAREQREEKRIVKAMADFNKELPRNNDKDTTTAVLVLVSIILIFLALLTEW